VTPTPPAGTSSAGNGVRIVVATTVMLTFISAWRAAAVVLNDMGSSAFYAGAIAEQALGKAAPWFVLAVMVFAFAVRSVYVESCSMFVRGGVYRVVKEALGSTLAKVSVSSLMFDYVLTGPISGVSAGHYIGGLINELLAVGFTRGWMPYRLEFSQNTMAVVFAILMTLYYWWQNVKGIEESSGKALRVMYAVTAMVVILLGWSAFTLLTGDYHLPPAPVPANLHFSEEALGFLRDTEVWKHFGLLAILIAFGHSILAMSGEETLAQVYREIGHPKLKNLKRAALIIAIYTFLFTGVGALLAVMIIPDDVRLTVYKDNIIAGLAMYMTGPEPLRLLFRGMVVIVGFLMLSGAINTSLVGSNGVMNRLSEDGVLTDWFRKPHRKFGTSYRIINIITALQLITILGSRGDVYLLGEAYAFGVIWSFAFKGASMLALRYKYHGLRGWKMPPNFRIRGVEIPVGLALVTMVLVATAFTNLLTKALATIAGIIFTTIFFLVFTLSERSNRRKLAARGAHDQFQLLHSDVLRLETAGVRPDNLLVTVRDYNTLAQLDWALQRTDTAERDVVVLEARLLGPGTGEYDVYQEQIFSDYEQTLFTRAVSVAESHGKRISLVVVPARDVWSAIVQTAGALESGEVVAGLSSKMTAAEQAFQLGRAWEALPEPKQQFVLHVVKPDLSVESFAIGPHEPSLRPEDIRLVHRIWLQVTHAPGLERVHHADIVSEALRRLAHEYGSHRESVESALRNRVPASAAKDDCPPAPSDPRA
jgi:amino acid transporter